MKIMTSPLKGMMKGRQEWSKMNELEFHGGSAGLEVPSANEGHASATKSNSTLGCIWTEMIHGQRNQDPKEAKSPEGEKENLAGRLGIMAVPRIPATLNEKVMVR